MIFAALKKISFILRQPVFWLEDTGHCWGESRIIRGLLRGLPGYGRRWSLRAPAILLGCRRSRRLLNALNAFPDWDLGSQSLITCKWQSSFHFEFNIINSGDVDVQAKRYSPCYLPSALASTGGSVAWDAIRSAMIKTTAVPVLWGHLSDLDKRHILSMYRLHGWKRSTALITPMMYMVWSMFQK